MTRCRLLIDMPQDGATNMATDEILLDRAPDESQLTLRFYRWSEPTLSLGYFQNHKERNQHTASNNCPIVRRTTGGGAILHDRELTYSLVVPGGDRLARDAAALYQVAHHSWILAIAEFGVEARLWEPDTTNAKPSMRFLCFERRSRNDVVVGDSKVLGSAQRRRRGAILQHGSCLLAASKSAPELPGLAEAAGVRLDTESLIAAWVAQLRSHLRLQVDLGELSKPERVDTRALARDKYHCAKWTLRR